MKGLPHRVRVWIQEFLLEITRAGARFFTEFGIELPKLRSTRRHFCRLCLDWTERRPHIAGTAGAAITKRYFDLGWMERVERAVIVTPVGRRGFRKTFGVDARPGQATAGNASRAAEEPR